MGYMFNGANSFNQDLCAWGDSFRYGYDSTYSMFQGTDCTFQEAPSAEKKGPFCASSCQD